MEEYNVDRELDWDDSIEHDSSGFVLLMEGEYPFTVTKFDRGRHPGSAKLPPCNKAILTIAVGDPRSAVTTITHNLFLHTKTEGMLCAFFTAIGARRSGEPLRMNWDAVVGAQGVCEIEVENYIGKRDGKEHQSNKIKRFLEPANVQQTQMQAAPSAPSYTPGTF